MVALMRIGLPRCVRAHGWLRSTAIPSQLSASNSTTITRCRALSTGSRDAFFSPDTITFDDFRLDSALNKALKSAGFDRPSRIQALGIDRLLEEKDAILAAETGSGKTLAYLLPIMTHIIREKTRLQESQSLPVMPSDSPLESDDDEVHKSHRKSHRYAWILCPSVDLCNQIQDVIQSLSLKAHHPLITSEISPAGLSRYTQRPDILIGTPGSLLQTLVDMRKDVRYRIVDGVGYVVIDEADLMLTGSYRSQLDQLFELLNFCERLMAIRSLSETLQISTEDFHGLKKHVRKAGIRGGVAEMIEVGYELEDGSIPVKAERPFWKRQFVFAGATIPSDGTKNVLEDIKTLFPHVETISTQDLHKTSTYVKYEWIQTTIEHRLDALLKVVQNDDSFQPLSSGRILIFAKDASAVDKTVKALEKGEIPCVAFHKKLGELLRRENLNRFRQEEGIVMVSTDGMSRGMDVENITHVIQSNFAPSAIAFVHRVGRTGRAGREGRVTSLFTDADRDLAEAIRTCMDSGVPVEGAFSRNRSFRRKFRRYGTFVPRGAVPSRSDHASTVT